MVKNKHKHSGICWIYGLCMCRNTEQCKFESVTPFPIILEKHELIQQNFGVSKILVIILYYFFFHQQALN